jgi:hypothetical protein
MKTSVCPAEYVTLAVFSILLKDVIVFETSVNSKPVTVLVRVLCSGHPSNVEKFTVVLQFPYCPLLHRVLTLQLYRVLASKFEMF